MVQKFNKRKQEKKSVNTPGKRKQIIQAQFSIEFLKELEQKSELEKKNNIVNLDCQFFQDSGENKCLSIVKLRKHFFYFFES